MCTARTSRPLVALLPALLLLSACSSLKQALSNQECRLLAGDPYDIVSIDLSRHAIKLVWKDHNGQPLQTIPEARTMLAADGDSVIALTNGGIFTREYTPLGLYVEQHQQHTPLHTGDGYGNFFLKPNGVFMVGDGHARIVATTQYDTAGPPPQYALQSGPLLVHDGAIHPAFSPHSTNCRLRTGIGIDQEGHVHVAISNGAVNLYDFANLFRQGLGCDDALYLDGAISTLYAPRAGRHTESKRRYATFLAVVALPREALPRQDSNLEPPGPEPGALPIELQGRGRVECHSSGPVSLNTLFGYPAPSSQLCRHPVTHPLTQQ